VQLVGVGGLIALAAGIVILVIVGSRSSAPVEQRPELDALASAAGEYRPFEPRLTGSFRHGPVASYLRGPSETRVPAAVRVEAARLATVAAQSRANQSRAAAAVGSLLIGDVDGAVSALESVTRDGRDAGAAPALWLSDLSAAYLVRADRDGRADDVQRAVQAALAATQRNPLLAQPWFNLALAYESSHRSDDARMAWQEYLSRDRSSPWAQEAARRVAPPPTSRP
jgi:tetratricopeptide (TPR) repeat protein